jgi:nickel transport protein
MRWILALIIAALILAGAASAHRMFVGQQITVNLFVFFDDGSPAANADVKLYQEGELFAENVTDATGLFTITLPGKGTGNWSYEVEGGGHTEKGAISINNTISARAGALGIGLCVPYLPSRKRRQVLR